MRWDNETDTSLCGLIGNRVWDLRKVKEDGQIEYSFVIAKSRTAPTPFVTVPRLELQAAVIVARMDSLFKREIVIPIARVVFWTDSTITLQCIRNETRWFKTHVASRVIEISNSSKPDQWRLVPGKENPVVDASRGQTLRYILQNERWFRESYFFWRRLTSESCKTTLTL